MFVIVCLLLLVVFAVVCVCGNCECDESFVVCVEVYVYEVLCGVVTLVFGGCGGCLVWFGEFGFFLPLVWHPFVGGARPSDLTWWGEGP